LPRDNWPALCSTAAETILFFAMFAQFRQSKRKIDGFLSPGEITLADLDTMYRTITRARGEELGLEQVRQDEPNHQFVETLARCLRTGDLESLKDSIVEDASRIRRIFRDQQLPARFAIRDTGALRQQTVRAAYPKQADRVGIELS
jgi:hypothetical protein